MFIPDKLVNRYATTRCDIVELSIEVLKIAFAVPELGKSIQITPD